MSRRRDLFIAQLRARRQIVAGQVRLKKRLPRMLAPDAISIEYGKALEPLIVEARTMLVREVYPEAQRAIEQASRARGDARFDATSINEKIDRLAEEFFKRNGPAEIAEVAKKFGKRTSGFQKAQLDAQIRSAFGVDIMSLDVDVTSKIDQFVESNVALIRSVPNKFFDEIENKITDGVRTGRRWESVSVDLEERYGIAKSRADLIARDQVGKFFGELNKVRQENLGVTGYVWRTSNDNRVRDEHELREGSRFEWNDPPVDGHPGEPVLCRCYAEPDLSAIFDALK